jgi:hypothetical protein
MAPVSKDAHLAVIHGEGHAQHILGVAHEAASGGASGQVPQAQSTVPRAGQSKLAVGGDHHILHEVGVAMQGPLGVTKGVISPLKVPDNDGLVTAGMKEQKSLATEVTTQEVR